jgi:hypothetical protein
VLVALTTAALWTRLGSEAAAWGMIAVPDNIGHRSPLMLMSLAATAAGLRLLRNKNTVRPARALLGAAACATLLFFLWPGRADSPLITFGRQLADMTQLPSFFYVLGHLLYSFLLAFPFAMGVLAAYFAVRPTRPVPRALPLLPTFGLSGFLCVLVLRSLLLTLGNTSIIAILGIASVLAAVLELMVTSLEVLTEKWVRLVHATTETNADRPSSERLPQPLGQLLRGSGLTALVLMVLVTPQAVLSQPPGKGVQWNLTQSSTSADEVFGARLTAWGHARLAWDATTRQKSSAATMVKMQAASRELLVSARKVHPELAAALQTLTVEGRDLDLAGLRWARLVADVNATSRKLELPYYADAFVSVRPGKDGMQRLFKVSGYRIEAVERVDVSGKEYATLHVRRLGEAREGHGLLGFSRDRQPFALVVKNEIEEEVAALRELAEGERPNCETEELLESAPARNMVRRETCERSWRVLQEELAAVDLLSVVTDMTERHELQHQIDGPFLPLARGLADRLRGVHEDARDRVNRELSAYLAEMSTNDSRPKLVLLRLLEFGRAGGISTYAQISAMAFSALTTEPLLEKGLDVDGLAVQRRFNELAQLDDERLRQRARNAWQELFRATLSRVTAAH